MTKRLEETFKRVSELSDEDQDMIAAQIEAMLEDDAAWDRRFASTPDSAFAKMAEGVRRQVSNGEVEPLDVDKL